VWRSDGAAIPRAFADAVADLGVAYAPLVARCLWNREVRDRDAAASFLRPTLAHGLRSPLLLKDMARAAARLADALRTAITKREPRPPRKHGNIPL